MAQREQQPRPVIAITAHVGLASWGHWQEMQSVLVPLPYIDHVTSAGGTAVVLPPLPSDATPDDARAVLAFVDGLIISGGPDVDPARYGQQRHPSVHVAAPQRDASELLLAQVTAEDDVPVLGVCRGMQVMTVAAGGSLEQHLPDRLGHIGHSPEIGRYGSHDVSIAEGTRLYDILGKDISVATYHHQGVDDMAGYKASAWADDGVVEALEDPGSLFRVGVQWHPERGDDPRLFEHLVYAARKRAALRSRASTY